MTRDDITTLGGSFASIRDTVAHMLPPHARMSLTTRPCTSVRRNWRP